jgi:hypothetical protein
MSSILDNFLIATPLPVSLLVADTTAPYVPLPIINFKINSDYADFGIQIFSSK